MSKFKNDRGEIDPMSLFFAVLFTGALVFAITGMSNSVGPTTASQALDRVAAAQATAKHDTGLYLGQDELISEGFITAGDADAGRELTVDVGADGTCFIASVPFDDDTLYISSRLTKVKTAASSDVPNTDWCGQH